MDIEERLRERLRKAESLFAGAATSGERDAAEAAVRRLRVRLAETARAEPPIELKLTVPDAWSARLLIALCRRYGLRPYRYPRQRRTTVMVRAPRSVFDAVVWAQFTALHEEMLAFFEETTERLIREAVYGDAADAETVPEALPGR
ncbi:conserved hypothetical protein [Methylobacterium sp. 4-46]|uniref:hypothetical protein n=1 Tax=unclassified Methylobacterium TaxID=2615210 RepID=UPI000152DBAE|nr:MULTISPECIES: hypothetical protein [Methylobacterium]ACA19521.1 conserved hypothetical protein [Methylobacterium sp. 4-46]WFT78717.1 hypothetical protein QA634_26140 [Methylobacterium nodulans]